MKFLIEHTFQGITRPEYEELYFDEPFAIATCKAVNLGRTLLRLDRTPERIVRHVRVEPAREIPAPVAKVLGGGSFAYVEEMDYAVGKYNATWRTIPSLMPDKVQSTGTMEIQEVPGGVKRVVKGEIKVSIFGIGGMVEKFVVAEVEKSYGDAADFTTKWIAEKKKA
jgi:hypothetical protein